MGTSGSVSYLFTKLGIFNYESGVDEDRLMEVALELGADDIVSEEDGSMEVICQADTFLDLQAALNNAELTPSFAEIEMRASTMAEVSEKDAEKIINLIDALEELDDVQNVYSNVEFPDGLLENLG
jgi:transcriptional/translational regulatory protein YebC/TACO1